MCLFKLILISKLICRYYQLNFIISFTIFLYYHSSSCSQAAVKALRSFFLKKYIVAELYGKV